MSVDRHRPHLRRQPSPAREAAADLLEPESKIPLLPPVGRLVIAFLDPEIILGGDAVGMVVGVAVSLPAAEGLRRRRMTVLKMPGDRDDGPFADILSGRCNRRRAGVALGGQRQIGDGLRQGELTLWQPDELGSAFERLTLDLGSDFEGPVVATLVRYLPEPARRSFFARW